MRSLFVVLTILLAGCTPSAQPPQPHQAPAKAAAKSEPPAVEAVKPERKSLARLVEQPGSIQAYEETQLYARVAGYVHLPRDKEGRLQYDIGRRIHGPKLDAKGQETEPGELLAEVAVPELFDEVRQKKSLIRQAEAEVEQAKKALASAEASIAASESAVLEAKALMDRWQSEARRITGLVAGGVIDAQSRDETQNQFKAASARVATTEAAVKKAMAERDKAMADLASVQARVEVRQADLSRAETMTAFARIRAPYDGVITARRVSNGDFVTAGGVKGEALLTVARIDPVRVVIHIPEVDASMVDPETAKVTLTIPALGSSPLADAQKLTRSSWALEPGSRTLRAEIDVPNKEGKLRPGMYVYARITSPLPESWTLPLAAVAKQGDAMTVQEMGDDGKATSRVVQVGRTDGKSIEILRIQRPGGWEEFKGSGTYAVLKR